MFPSPARRGRAHVLAAMLAMRRGNPQTAGLAITGHVEDTRMASRRAPRRGHLEYTLPPGGELPSAE